MFIGFITNWIFGERDVSTSIVNKLGIGALFTAVTGFITWFTQVIIDGIDKVALILLEIVNSKWPTVDLSIIRTIASIANAFFPLVESLTCFGVLYVFWALVLIVRWIKSFTPTLSN